MDVWQILQIIELLCIVGILTVELISEISHSHTRSALKMILKQNGQMLRLVADSLKRLKEGIRMQQEDID
jgi:hypothetical protein